MTGIQIQEQKQAENKLEKRLLSSSLGTALIGFGFLYLGKITNSELAGGIGYGILTGNAGIIGGYYMLKILERKQKQEKK